MVVSSTPFPAFAAGFACYLVPWILPLMPTSPILGEEDLLGLAQPVFLHNSDGACTLPAEPARR